MYQINPSQEATALFGRTRVSAQLATFLRPVPEETAVACLACLARLAVFRWVPLAGMAAVNALDEVAVPTEDVRGAYARLLACRWLVDVPPCAAAIYGTTARASMIAENRDPFLRKPPLQAASVYAKAAAYAADATINIARNVLFAREHLSRSYGADAAFRVADAETFRAAADSVWGHASLVVDHAADAFVDPDAFLRLVCEDFASILP